MNKNLYRVIFSKPQQRLVLVSELAKTEGKSAALPKVKADDFFSLAFGEVFRDTSGQIEEGSYTTNLCGDLELVQQLRLIWPPTRSLIL